MKGTLCGGESEQCEAADLFFFWMGARARVTSEAAVGVAPIVENFATAVFGGGLLAGGARGHVLVARLEEEIRHNIVGVLVEHTPSRAKVLGNSVQSLFVSVSR